MFFAILEKINRAHQVVLNELTTACHATNTGKNTGDCGCVDKPVAPGQRGDVLLSRQRLLATQRGSAGEYFEFKLPWW